jgi:hypothetical protein
MRDEFFEPKATSQSDDNNVICPYCKHEFQPEAEDYSEDIRTHECFECGKKFRMYQIFSVSHYSKPDCELNDETHDWDVVSVRTTNFQSCGNCGKWRPTPPVEPANTQQHLPCGDK